MTKNAFIAKKNTTRIRAYATDMSGNSPQKAGPRRRPNLRRYAILTIAIRNYNENATVPCYSGRDSPNCYKQNSSTSRREMRSNKRSAERKERKRRNSPRATRKRPIPLAANAQKGGAATAHAAPRRHALMAMHELIAARFPVKAHARQRSMTTQPRTEIAGASVSCAPYATSTTYKKEPASAATACAAGFEKCPALAERHVAQRPAANRRKHAQRNGHHETGAAERLCSSPPRQTKPTGKRIGHEHAVINAVENLPKEEHHHAQKQWPQAANTDAPWKLHTMALQQKNHGTCRRRSP